MPGLSVLAFVQSKFMTLQGGLDGKPSCDKMDIVKYETGLKHTRPTHSPHSRCAQVSPSAASTASGLFTE